MRCSLVSSGPLLIALCLFFVALAGLSAPALALDDDLTEHVKAQVQEGYAPAAQVVFIEDGHTQINQTFGDASGSFNLGSAAGSLSAVATLHLLKAEGISLDDPIVDVPGVDAVDAFLHHLNDGPNDAWSTLTWRHLLDHRSGLGESTTAIRTPSPEEPRSLEQSLLDHFPPFVASPGERYQRSHHATALAAHLAATASGRDYPAFLSAFLFAPLGMDDAWSVAEGPDGRQMAKGHIRISGRLQPQPHRGVGLAPVDGLYVSTDDMEALLRFLSPPDTSGESPLIDALHALQQTSFQPHGDVDGVTPGFSIRTLDGDPWFSATGESADGFSSLLLFSPERQTGLYLGYNSDLGASLREDIIDLFRSDEAPSDHALATGDDASERIDEIRGTYRHHRTVLQGFMKPLGALMALRATIDHHRDDDLDEPHMSMDLSMDHQARLWRPVADDPDLWQSHDGHFHLVTYRDDDGGIAGFYHDAPDLRGFERLPAHQHGSLVAAAIAAFVMIFLAALIVWPLLALARRFGDGDDQDDQQSDADGATDDQRTTAATRWAVAYSGVALLFWTGYAFVAGRQVFGVPDWSPLVFSLPFLLILLCPWLLWHCIQHFQHQRGSSHYRLAYLAVTAAAWLMIPALFAWDLLGYQW